VDNIHHSRPRAAGAGAKQPYWQQAAAAWLLAHDRLAAWCLQVVLSHTPMQPLAVELGQQPVLVVGRHQVAAVAESYGFSKVLTTRQLAAALGPGALPFLPHSTASAGQQIDAGVSSSAVPDTCCTAGAAACLVLCCALREQKHNRPSTLCSRWPPHERAVSTCPAAGAGGVCPVRDLGWGSEQQPIAAVLVCSDPTGHDWYQVQCAHFATLTMRAAAGCKQQRRVPVQEGEAQIVQRSTY
jgi:hypothetical protein